MRTKEEIKAMVAKCEEENNLFDFRVGNLLMFLDFEDLGKYLKEGVTKEQWVERQLPLTDDAVKAQILDYLPFAWEKANGCRGLSTMRSLSHFSSWLWLLGEEELSNSLATYDHYGKGHLVTISEKYGFDWRAADDDCWRSSETDDGQTANEVLGRT